MQLRDFLLDTTLTLFSLPLLIHGWIGILLLHLILNIYRQQQQVPRAPADRNLPLLRKKPRPNTGSNSILA